MSGIIDPAKVTRSAVENAASIAAMILTTDALITDIPEKNPAPMMPPGGGGDDSSRPAEVYWKSPTCYGARLFY